MPFYIGDYLRDTGHLTTIEHGSYLLLLMHAWSNNGVLPNDEVRLRNIAKMSVREWKRSSHTLMAFFYVEGDTLRHRRIDRELANAVEITEQKSAAGRIAGLASAAKRAAERSNENSTTVEQKSNGRSNSVDVSLQRSSTPSQSHTPLEKETSLREAKKPDQPRQKARSQISPDWKPTAAGIAYAQARGVQPTEVRAFKDFHIAKGNTMADWDAAWRTWCNHAVKFGNAAPLLKPRDDVASPMVGGF